MDRTEAELVQKELESETATAVQQILTLIEQKAIDVNDRELLIQMLNSLKESQLEALLQITRYLIDRGYTFSVEVYGEDYNPENSTERLYYLIHFDSDITDEVADDEILKIMQYVESVDKNHQLWFVNVIDF